MTNTTDPKKMPTQAALMRSSLVIYSVMATVGFEICWWYHKNTSSLFAVRHMDWFLYLRIAAVGILFLLLGQHCLEEFFPSYRRLKLAFAQIFRGLHSWQIIVLALLSSVGEEILFRGAMQPFLGVWLTSIVFAILHIDPEGKVSVWTAWALVGGVIMGFAAKVTGSLWPSMIIHFGVNAISIARVARLMDREILQRNAHSLSSGSEQ